MSQRNFRIVSIASLIFAPGLLAQAPAPSARVITSMSPLADAADLLRHLYGKVITYEGPLWVWPGDLEPMPGRDPNLKNPKPQGFVMPADTGSEPNLGVVLQRTIEGYHQQTTGPRFTILTSKWGYHIVPTQVHDENGALVPARNLLDARITLPETERNPQAHLFAFAAAVSTVTGVRLEPLWYGDGFDRLFRSSPARFTWGVNNAVARDALIDLLERSATTFLWNLECQSSARPEDWFCGLNMHMLEVSVTDPQNKPAKRVLKFDRCGDCLPAAPRQ